jgi:hypothetical protein
MFSSQLMTEEYQRLLPDYDAYAQRAIAVDKQEEPDTGQA